MNIAFIGLGIMGTPMAMHLLKNGHELTVHNRTKTKAEPLLHQGAKWADTPADAAKDAEVVITMLTTPEVVEAAALGENGFLTAGHKNLIWINSSTVNPSFSKKMAKEAEERGVRFIDAPVSGSKIPAQNAELLFLVGGETEAVNFCTPLFKAMGQKSFHIGKAGQGSAMKMVINLMLGESMRAFAEALMLGKSMDIPQEMLLETLIKTPVAAPILSVIKSRIEAGDTTPNFPLKHMRKDLHLALQCAYEADIALPGAAATGELYAQALQSGRGDQDFSAILAWMEQNIKESK